MVVTRVTAITGVVEVEAEVISDLLSRRANKPKMAMKNPRTRHMVVPPILLTGDTLGDRVVQHQVILVMTAFGTIGAHFTGRIILQDSELHVQVVSHFVL
jgi:hypothetical protein